MQKISHGIRKLDNKFGARLVKIYYKISLLLFLFFSPTLTNLGCINFLVNNNFCVQRLPGFKIV